jgi:hypothetical protein
MDLNGVTQIQSDFKNGGFYSALKFHDVTIGNNGGFQASSGWDPVTGLGSFKSDTSASSSTTKQVSDCLNIIILLTCSILFL